MKNRKTSSNFRQELRERYGTKCHICGEEGAEYHHIIPLWMGGEDIVENFIPLCHHHHLMVHGAHVRGWDHGKVGRKRKKPPEGYEAALDLYFTCYIGTSECKGLLGIKQQRKLNDLWWFGEYKEKQGIVDYRNNIDIIEGKNKGEKAKFIGAEIAGWTKYKDGRVVTYPWSQRVD